MSERLAREIRENGPLGFDRFMAAALYDPQHGYYAGRRGQVGRAGDFFTSVSVGPLFGHLLARHLVAFWEEIGRPERWRILEVGAHEGQLAADILAALPELDATAAGAVEHAIVEPLPSLAAAQRERLGERVTIVGAPGDLDPLPGMLIANEVLDALPCHLVESTGDGWIELGVGFDDGFQWVPLGPAGELAENLPRRPAGYRTEVRRGLDEFLRGFLPALAPCRMLWIDYGYERDDYYAEGRVEGTLRTFSRHRAGDDPLDAPGSRDISAHVDFTSLREATEASGGEVMRFENQGRFLTKIARPWLLSLEGRTDAARSLRQFQTLTHPGQLGSRFHVMEAAWRTAPLCE
ncbi:class I SAM-dependent methyltransferase [Haloferula sp. A504]|uniref:class I SAM-dependent methyltransferase n=1 Tax=Haloferula sp. A504 TaxID=3373601 RepID=UPI0031C51EF3|nr:SAM-dependent methyltransferase [Verrucomicrobiaceae bacterium E54]